MFGEWGKRHFRWMAEKNQIGEWHISAKNNQNSEPFLDQFSYQLFIATLNFTFYRIDENTNIERIFNNSGCTFNSYILLLLGVLMSFTEI